MAWYAKIDDEAVGPLTDRDVHRLVREGKIGRRTPMRRDDGPWTVERLLEAAFSRVWIGVAGWSGVATRLRPVWIACLLLEATVGRACLLF